MSLLFDTAISEFEVESASLHRATDADLDTQHDAIPVRPIAEFASHHDTLEHREEDWICIPLHGQESAEAKARYLGYTDHSLHGPIFIFESDDGRDFLAVEEFAQTRLAHRIRFWHSDYLPETYPPSYDSPVNDNEPARNPVDPTSLFDGLSEYVAAEREATRDANREQAAKLTPTAIYQQESSGAIPTLKPIGEDDQREYRFRVRLDDDLQGRRDGDWAFFVESEFGIHEGNEVLLHSVDETADESTVCAEATVKRIRGLNVWLTVHWESVSDQHVQNQIANGHGKFGLSTLLNPVPFDREMDAIEALREQSLRDVLSGERPITFANGAAAESEKHDEELNQEQQLAVEHALLADDLFCIHGPPGTGKTRTLIEIIRRTVEQGEDVLVCADSNQAVDNLLVGGSTRSEADPQSLHAYGQHGHEAFTLDRRNAKRSRNDVVARNYRDVAGRADVVATTNNSAGDLAREFDVVVIDEATQATCPGSCVPLARANKVILAGDHKQLPPYSATETPPDSEFGHSLFEHLYAEGGVYEGVGVQLQTQYRMHRDIAYFPNRQFYDGSLRNGRAIDPLPDRPTLEGYNVGGSVTSVDHSKANHTESRLVVHLVQQLLEDVEASDIGVITPYSAQVTEIRDTLADHVECSREITVDTIDSFQGSEREAIILSLVRSNADGNLGFLGRPGDGPRRMNVALTRAKRYCAVVADWHTLRYDASGKCDNLYEQFHQHFENTGRLNHVDPGFIPI